jgi:hypothetical protein
MARPTIKVWNDGEAWRFRLLDEDDYILAEECGHPTEANALIAAKRLRREYGPAEPLLMPGEL